jgi:molybdopterin molybdotransferase
MDVCEAAGRVLAAEMEAARALPAADRAGANGYAIRSADTVGAGDYNPLELALVEAEGGLAASQAASIGAGDPLPRGADAILPFDLARENGAVLEIFGAVAEGCGVERMGQHVQPGTRLMESGRILLPQDIGLLASLDVKRAQVVRRPGVRILVGHPKKCGELSGQGDANGPMLRALVERDGGSVVDVTVLAMAGELEPGNSDLLLVAGRSGTGWGDFVAPTIAEVGELAIHGIALRPGGSAGMGTVGGVTVMLLPGDPLACLCAYDMLAGRLIRRLGGRSAELPYKAVEAEVAGKINSAIGTVDVCRVQFENGKAKPMGSAESGGVASAVRADGFVVVPAPLEGYAPGAKVWVYVYGSSSGETRPGKGR